jgi:chromosome segregation ATPase
VKTLQIYRGAMAFIVLQLVGLTIAGFFPSMVNYLPNRTYLTSETAPPPQNPRLQECLEGYLFSYYDEHGDALRASVDKVRTLNLDYLPDDRRKFLRESLDMALNTFALVAQVRQTSAAREDYAPSYRPAHLEVRRLQAEMRKIDEDIITLDKERVRLSRVQEPPEDQIQNLAEDIEALKAKKKTLDEGIPATWKQTRKRYVDLANAEKRARGNYRRNVDSAYQAVTELRNEITGAEALAALDGRLAALEQVIAEDPPEQAMETIKEIERALNELKGIGKIKSPLSKARRALKAKGDKEADREKAGRLLAEARQRFALEVAWRQTAVEKMAPALASYDDAIRGSIGLRLQKRLTTDQAAEIASCLSVPRDISLNF